MSQWAQYIKMSTATQNENVNIIISLLGLTFLLDISFFCLNFAFKPTMTSKGINHKESETTTKKTYLTICLSPKVSCHHFPIMF